MIQLTRRDLEHAYDQVSNVHRVLKGHRTAGENIARHAMTGVEVLAGAAVSGIVAGRFGAPYLTVAGQNVPLDALAGVGLHALAFFGTFGNYGEHVHNFATGVLSQYVARWGVGYGSSMREKAGLPRVAGTSESHAFAAPAAAPRMASPGRGPLTEAELAAIASRAR